MMPMPEAAVEPRVWSRRLQCALAVGLLLVIGLIAWAASRSSQHRPVELQKAGSWQRIDLNEADAEQLRGIPGIDAKLAQRIVDDRETNGRYQTVDELDRVKGIGAGTLAKIRPYVTVKSSRTAPNETVAVALHTPATEKPLTGRKGTPSEPLDLNTATLEQLQTLPGIGRVLAQRIAEWREQTPFRSVEDLRRVRGIGETTYKNVRPYVKVAAQGA